MKRRIRGTICAGLLVLGFTGAAQAALHDRGGGLIYDDVLDITWLQDANHGAGSAYDDGSSSTDGMMTWDNAVAWAANLTVGATRTWTEPGSVWRLPTVGPVDGSAFDYNLSHNGSTDVGYNISAPGSAYPGSTGSELAHMFYVTLGNKSYKDTSGDYAQPGWGLTNSGLFGNLKSYVYWSGTEYAPGTDYAWYFNTYYGSQDYNNKDSDPYAWAVRSGDVSAVPVPAAAWLFGVALVGLLVVARRKRTN